MQVSRSAQLWPQFNNAQKNTPVVARTEESPQAPLRINPTLLGQPKQVFRIETPPKAPRSQAQVVVSQAGEQLTTEQMFGRMEDKKLIYVGETHDQSAHHAAQLAVIKGLVERGRTPEVGLEMMPYVDQPIIDAYMEGSISEASFRAHWDARWGMYELYAPILYYAKEQGLRVRGLNIPGPVIRAVARGGLEALTPEERALLPEKINPISNPDYLAFVIAEIGGHGPVPPDRMKRMILAQTVWNEVMGEQALQALQEGAESMVVVAGSGHMVFEAGIAESVRYRSGVGQSVVMPFPVSKPGGSNDQLVKELQRDPKTRTKGSFFWLTPKDPSRPSDDSGSGTKKPRCRTALECLLLDIIHWPGIKK